MDERRLTGRKATILVQQQQLAAIDDTIGRQVKVPFAPDCYRYLEPGKNQEKEEV
jgi:hypothetical protein